MIDTVVCDVGGVIISFDEAVAARIEAHHGLDTGTLLPAVLKSEPSVLAMRGAIDGDQWMTAVSDLVGRAAVLDWLDYHGTLNEQVVAHLKSVKNRGVKVVLLSNATGRLWDDLRFHGLDSLADMVLCSASIGQVKPDSSCYRHAARQAQFDLNRAFYVDDTPSWVDAGAALGMRGHVFTSADALERELAALGWLP
ncbi:HAD-IA family hydrolase [Sphaerisporangium sp. NPDC051017]|uniref:HAD-IA family hydrolase n=1 Tax=Sphaerisporangium sp. NPDC051017 TaxID=3154636 RepID=UPI00342B38EE